MLAPASVARRFRFFPRVALTCAIAFASTARAADPSTACEAARLKAAAVYSSCLLKAEAVALLSGVPADTARCVAKYDKKCGKAAAKYGAACPGPADCAAIRTIAQCAADALPVPTTTTTTMAPPTTTTTLPGCTSGGPAADVDADGFTPSDGDCDDCDALVNPGAFDIPGNTTDDDCDGTTDNAATSCDSSLALDSASAADAAKALELCRTTTELGRAWGVISATWVRASGAPFSPGAQSGLMGSFGTNVPAPAGDSMVVLSTGRARTSAQPGACGSPSCTSNASGTAPAGFPQAVPSCPVSASIADDVALELRLRVPTNVAGYRFRLDFYSFEYPEWVCTSFNDQFVVIANPAPAGSINGNVSFDATTTPISVNTDLAVCAGCPLGTGALAGTGFDAWDDSGATGWLVTQAPATAGSIMTLRFAIWDSGDQSFDSTVLLDGFEWIPAGPVNVATTPAP